MQVFPIPAHEIELSNTTDKELLLNPTSYLDNLYADLTCYSTEFTLELKLIFHDLILKGQIRCEISVRAKALGKESLQ